MDLIQFKNIKLAYEDVVILQNLSFNISSGQCVGILGPNGSGKTTILRALAGVLKPLEGKLIFNQKEIHKYKRKELAKEISVLPQENDLTLPFSAFEVVLMGRSPYLKNFEWESAQDHKITEKVMRETDCWQFACRDIRSLSGGEKERVFLARALAQEPQVLLLDEPTTHLDLQHQKNILQLLKQLKKQLTMVMVLHDFNFAAELCDKVLMLSKGELIFDGNIEEGLSVERIQEVFDVNVDIIKHPQSGRSVFI